ncbi:hypothetical protein MTO96_011705 [Rhipicephalus appendiculatus]
MKDTTSVTLVFFVSLLPALENVEGTQTKDNGSSMFLLPVRNGTYVIPVRANGKFLPVLTILTGNGSKENVQSLVPQVKTEVKKKAEPQQQVVLLPVLIDARMFQAALAHSHGFGSPVDERPRGVRDVVYCFTARGTEMCVRTDLSAGRVTAVARSLKERGKKRRKRRPRKKGRRHRKMFRSSHDALKEMFWPRKSEVKSVHPPLKNTMEVFTFKNLTPWRSIRWERVVNATGLGNDSNASDKLKQTLQKPPEKSVTAQAVKDILLLHELLDLTSWTTDKKWKAFEEGCKLLVTKETAAEPLMQDRQIMESGWGPGIDPPNILSPKEPEKASAFDMNSDELKNKPDWDLPNVDKFKHTATNKGKSISERRTSRTSVYGTKIKWKEGRGKMPDFHDIYALAKHGNGRGGPGIWLSDRSTAYPYRDNVRYKKQQSRSLDYSLVSRLLTPEAEHKISENMKLFNSSSKRLVLFAQAVSLGTQQSEYGWKLLTLGFDMFRNKTHITEKEMKDVIGTLPGPTYGIQFQMVINSIIVYDLLIFNGTNDYDSWRSMVWQRLTIMAVSIVSRKIQSQLSTAGLLKTINDWYVTQLTELIMLRLIMMSDTYSSDTVVSSPMPEDSEENDSGTGQPSGPGAHPVLIVAEAGDGDDSSQYTSARTPAVQQTEMSAKDDIVEKQ